MQLGHVIRALRSMPRIFLGGVPQERAGDRRLAIQKLGLSVSDTFTLASDAFDEGAPIPVDFTADGANRSPPLRWSQLPEGTKSLALLVEDPDAPTPNPFVHWLVYNIPRTATSVTEALSQGATTGRNSMMRPAWTGCAPPKGDHPHRYVFQLFALDTTLDLGPQPGRTALLNALRGHVLAATTLTGTYQR